MPHDADRAAHLLATEGLRLVPAHVRCCWRRRWLGACACRRRWALAEAYAEMRADLGARFAAEGLRVRVTRLPATP